MHDECTGCDVTLEWAVCAACVRVTDAVCIFRHGFREKCSSFINNWALISSGRESSGQRRFLRGSPPLMRPLGSTHTLIFIFSSLSLSFFFTVVHLFVFLCVSYSLWDSDSSCQFNSDMGVLGSSLRPGVWPEPTRKGQRSGRGLDCISFRIILVSQNLDLCWWHHTRYEKLFYYSMFKNKHV